MRLAASLIRYRFSLPVELTFVYGRRAEMRSSGGRRSAPWNTVRFAWPPIVEQAWELFSDSIPVPQALYLRFIGPVRAIMLSYCLFVRVWNGLGFNPKIGNDREPLKAGADILLSPRAPIQPDLMFEYRLSIIACLARNPDSFPKFQLWSGALEAPKSAVPIVFLRLHKSDWLQTFTVTVQVMTTVAASWTNIHGFQVD
jgi:hypothetical protein